MHTRHRAHRRPTRGTGRAAHLRLVEGELGLRLREHAAAQGAPHAPVSLCLAVHHRDERERLGGLGKLARRLDLARRVSLEVYSDEPYVAVLRDYLSLEACKQLEGEAAKAGLKSATVLDGAGAGGGVAGERRAKQATIPRGALSSRLVERAAAVGEKIVGYGLRGSAAFQEPLAFVEYDAGSEYAAHADGAASGAYVTGGRVASVVHYCAAPSSALEWVHVADS